MDEEQKDSEGIGRRAGNRSRRPVLKNEPLDEIFETAAKLLPVSEQEQKQESNTAEVQPSQREEAVVGGWFYCPEEAKRAGWMLSHPPALRYFEQTVSEVRLEFRTNH